MTINIGDKVRFLNDVGGGLVVKILKNKMVLVENEEGFEYPINSKELIVIEKAKKNEPVIEKVESDKTHFSEDKQEAKFNFKKDNLTNIVFGFVRNIEDKKDGFDCYLINDSNFSLFYHVVLKLDTGFKKLDAEILEANTKIHVVYLSRDEINLGKEIIIQILFFDNPLEVLKPQIERKIKIVPLNFFQEHLFVENDFIVEKAYIFELLKENFGLGQSNKTNEDFERKILEKEIPEEDKSKRYSARQERKTIEVDLHINELVESVVGMTNSEILAKQMEVFHQTMTEAIMSKAGKVILIHGIGNGTLKASLRESLSKQYKLHFEDASFQEYGFGATMVLL
ncbi:MAG: DUF2027 domain-containing protein [Bacteroidales bacterium]|nr:DUF2027 domain-containing protein [Bacteroidales bacterium]MDY0314898.1 DUF2027 domain-containing protein [Bacteroidales bacterium]NLB86149.1 DUF2027 domain-containing protein [Bacteroidales bacterium]